MDERTLLKFYGAQGRGAVDNARARLEELAAAARQLPPGRLAEVGRYLVISLLAHEFLDVEDLDRALLHESAVHNRAH
jgi:hypothetical protein